MQNQSNRFFSIIQSVRDRRKTLIILRGTALTISVAAALLLLGGLAAYRYRVSTWQLFTLRIMVLTGLIGVVYFFLVRPLRRKINDTLIARLVEEKHTGLDDRLVSAVEFSADPQSTAQSNALVGRLIEDTDLRTHEIRTDEIIPSKRLWQMGGAAAAGVAIFIAALIFGPEELIEGTRALLNPLTPPTFAEAKRCSVQVKPGNARVPKGSDQKIIATMININTDKVTVFTQKAGDSQNDVQWIGQQMEPAKKVNEFQYFIFNILEDTNYFVESNGCRSDVFKLIVADLPFVKRIDQTQFAPAYTHLPPKTIEDAPDIAVLEGTKVKITAKLTSKAKAARIVLADGTKIEMEGSGENDFAGTLTVTKNTSYHIELTSIDGDTFHGSNEHDISLLDDRPPSVTFDKPGRDTRATSVEEIFTQAKAEDDYGVVSLDLYYSVNGGEEKKVDLQKLPGESARVLSGAHTFFLEEFGLEPGDLISYYAKARDARKEATSDIYFIEIKPFQKDYKQNQAPGGGGGEQDGQQALTRRQKEIVAATFRINREEKNYDEKEKTENYNTVTLSQEKVHADATALIDRIKRRLGDQINEQKDFAKLVEHLTEAAKAMEPAITELKARKGKDALPNEQKALQQLMRADAIFREMQISFSQDGQGSNAQAQELADLFELELDKQKNQYETLRRERQQQNQQQDDETKRRLEELSRRMQRELEQQQQRMQAPRNSSGGGGGQQQQQMIEEARKAARELERLSRERRDPQLMDLSNKLNQAADQMQRAQNAAQNNKQSEALANNLRAQQQLDEARRRLNQLQQSQGGKSIQDLRRRAAEAASKQQEIANDLDEMARRNRSGAQQDQASNEAKQRMAERKGALANEVDNLERDIDQTARGLSQEQQQAANKLRDASNSIRNNKVSERIRRTKQLVENNAYDNAREGDQKIQQNLNDVAQMLQDAEKNAQRQAPGGETEESLNKVRQLGDSLESMTRRLRDPAQRGNQQQGQQGQQGEQQAQQGQQQGQQGQKGQQQAQGQQQGQQNNGQTEGGGGGPQGSRTNEVTPHPQSPQFPSGGGPPRSAADRQFGAELRQYLREAEDLRRNLGRDRDLGRPLDQAIQSLREATDSITRDDMRTALLLKNQVIDPLRSIELELSKRLQAKLGKNNLKLSDEGAAPAEYRKLVDEYYKRLSSRSQ